MNFLDKHRKKFLLSKEAIEKTFLDLLLKKGALKVIQSVREPFILKSGRASPYFINIGALTDGESLVKIKWAFTSFIVHLLEQGMLEKFNFIFGPAYKGITLAALSCEGLSEIYGINTRYIYDRKEVKSYGDISADKIIVGANHFNREDKILLIDDVVTTGETKIDSLEKLKVLGSHTVVGLVLLVDRQEKMSDKNQIVKKSAVTFIQEELGIKVFSILTSKKIFDLMKENLSEAVINYWIDYNNKYVGETPV